MKKVPLKDVPPNTRIRIAGAEAIWLGVLGSYGRLDVYMKPNRRKTKKPLRYEIHAKKLGELVEVL